MDIIFTLFLHSVLLFQGMIPAQDTIDDIPIHFKNGNTKDLAASFANTVSLSISADESVYSKVQAEIVLRDFFAKHDPSGVKVLHRLDSGSSHRYIVFNLSTARGVFKISVVMKSTDDRFLITEIRIDPSAR